MKIRIYKGRNGQWNIQFKARNGNILFTGTGWNKKATALKTLRRFIDNIFLGQYTQK